MLILPVAGDKIKTANEIPLKVFAYTRYEQKGPAVLCEGVDSKSITVLFKDIAFVNDIPVALAKNAQAFNVLETDGYIKRDVELPQPKDEITAGWSDYKIRRLNLQVRNQVSRGLIFDCENLSTGEVEEVLLHQIVRVKHSLSTKSRLTRYYRDYISVGYKNEPSNE